MATYLTACLLAFFQQQRLYREQEVALRPFNLERPLWIFVGGSVTATLARRDASDIVEILRFLAGYVGNRAAGIERIRKVLNEGLVTTSGRNLFAGRFTYLNTTGLSPEQVFDETLATRYRQESNAMNSPSVKNGRLTSRYSRTGLRPAADRQGVRRTINSI